MSTTTHRPYTVCFNQTERAHVMNRHDAMCYLHSLRQRGNTSAYLARLVDSEWVTA